MSTDFHQRLTSFDLARGKDPIDGTRIEGFGNPGDAPAPPLKEADIAPASDSYGPPIDVPAPAAERSEPVSPLVEMGMQQHPERMSAREFLGKIDPAIPFRAMGVDFPTGLPLPKEADLWITDEQAVYKGRKVELLKAEQDAVAKIVIRALRRDLASLEVGSKRVRARGSRRTVRGPVVQPTASEPSVSLPKKKRGRPRGSLLHPTK